MSLQWLTRYPSSYYQCEILHSCVVWLLNVANALTTYLLHLALPAPKLLYLYFCRICATDTTTVATVVLWFHLNHFWLIVVQNSGTCWIVTHLKLTNLTFSERLLPDLALCFLTLRYLGLSLDLFCPYTQLYITLPEQCCALLSREHWTNRDCPIGRISQRALSPGRSAAASQ